MAAYVRHAIRHVRASLEERVRLALVDWLSDTPPFEAATAVLDVRAPQESDLKPIVANRIFVSHGGEVDTLDAQLGSGLLRWEHVLFVDILGQNPGIALAIASDLLDDLRGLRDGSSRWVDLRERGTGALLPGWEGELEDVMRDEPRSSLASWQSIKATLIIYLPGESR